MAGFEMQEWIDVTPETVFQTLHKPELAPAIVESVIRNEQITEGAVGVGTRFRETRIVNGQEGSSELEVIVFEPNTRYAVSNETEGITSAYHYHLTPEKGGTRIKLVAEVSAGGLKKMVVPVVVGVLKKEDANHLAHLKAHLEGAKV